MIENLTGIHEIVNFKESTRLRLYVNDECERYPAHWHTPLEILFPLEDEYEAICGQTHYLLRTGDILFICPGVIHDLPARSTGVRIIFQADCTVLYAIHELEQVLSLMAPALLITPEGNPTVHPAISRLLLEIRDEYLADQPLCESAIYSRLIEILVSLGRNCTHSFAPTGVKSARRQKCNEKMLDICNYVSEHCTEELCLDDLAARSGYSKYYFDRLFKDFTGMSGYQYLTQKRIACAERLLITPDISITEVAMQSGFSNVTTFTRMFKLVKKCTPSQFRGMHHG